MANPFKTRKGFGLRLNYAVTLIREYGYNPSSRINYDRISNNRKFDNCFENYDDDALVYAIMEKIYEQNDANLEKGVKAMGKHLYNDWTQHYYKAKNKQYCLF